MNGSSYSYITDPGVVKAALLNRDKNIKGGVDVFIIGNPGCGKTTALGQVAMGNMKQYDDIIIWRGSEDCQWSLFLNLKEKDKIDVIYWLREGITFKAYNRKEEKEVNLKDYVKDIRYYKNAEDLVKRIEKGAINVVETTPFSDIDMNQHYQFCLEWLEIMLELTKRIWNRGVTICFDEVEDLAPEGASKSFWKIEVALSSLIRKMRKNDISLFLAGHSLTEIHWRIRRKIRWKMYMRGGIPPKESRIAMMNTNILAIGQAVIEGGNFERFSFESLGNEKMLRMKFMIGGITEKGAYEGQIRELISQGVDDSEEATL